MKHPGAIVLVFSRAPVAGEVKTRLVPYIDKHAAADLQRELVHDRLEMLIASKLSEVQLWCSPDTSHPFFSECAERYGITLKAQSGSDLGERMSNASRELLQDYNKVVIIGTDAPALGSDMIDQAIGELDNHDAVFVPAEDGGYVLIGMTTHHDALLADISWGTGRVLQQTINNLEQLGLRYSLLEQCWDIDRPEDLERYRALRVGYENQSADERR